MAHGLPAGGLGGKPGAAAGKPNSLTTVLGHTYVVATGADRERLGRTFNPAAELYQQAPVPSTRLSSTSAWSKSPG